LRISATGFAVFYFRTSAFLARQRPYSGTFLRMKPHQHFFPPVTFSDIHYPSE